MLDRRQLLTLLPLGAAATLAGRAARADLPPELTQPALLTPLAANGLFNSITRAGNRLVAAGERGRIMLSDDHGAHWRQVPVPVSVTLIQARFLTPSTGWATGQMGVILKTTDAGETWQKQMDGLTAAQLMLAEAQADAARPDAPKPDPNSLNPTELQAAQGLVSEGASNPMLAVLPLSAAHVLAFGAFGLALESLDGGKTWAGIASRVADPGGLHIYAAAVAGDQIILAGEQGFLARGPADGTLSALTSPFNGSLFGLLALPGGGLLAFGLQGTTLRSNDQGASWTANPPFPSDGLLSGVVLSNGRVLFGDATGNLILSMPDAAKFTLSSGLPPVAALAQAADGGVIAGTLAGLHRLPPSAFGQNS